MDAAAAGEAPESLHIPPPTAGGCANIVVDLYDVDESGADSPDPEDAPPDTMPMSAAECEAIMNYIKQARDENAALREGLLRLHGVFYGTTGHTCFGGVSLVHMLVVMCLPPAIYYSVLYSSPLVLAAWCVVMPITLVGTFPYRLMQYMFAPRLDVLRRPPPAALPLPQ